MRDWPRLAYFVAMNWKVFTPRKVRINRALVQHAAVYPTQRCADARYQLLFACCLCSSADGCGYAQVYFPSDVETAVERNQARAKRVTESVSSSVYESSPLFALTIVLFLRKQRWFGSRVK